MCDIKDCWYCKFNMTEEEHKQWSDLYNAIEAEVVCENDKKREKEVSIPIDKMIASRFLEIEKYRKPRLVRQKGYYDKTK